VVLSAFATHRLSRYSAMNHTGLIGATHRLLKRLGIRREHGPYQTIKT
jgi:hypothetical protein